MNYKEWNQNDKYQENQMQIVECSENSTFNLLNLMEKVDNIFEQVEDPLLKIQNIVNELQLYLRQYSRFAYNIQNPNDFSEWLMKYFLDDNPFEIIIQLQE